MPAVVVIVLLLAFGLWMRRKYKQAVRRWEISTGRRSTDRLYRRPPEPISEYPIVGPPAYPHGVVRPAVGKFGESCLEVDIRSWFYVRELELEALGEYYHRADGTTNACGWEPIDEGAEAAHAKTAAYQKDLKRAIELGGQNMSKRTQLDAATRARIIAEGMVDEDPWAEVHKCRNCGSVDTWQSSIDGHWRCHKADCQPCYCGHCNGRIGEHNYDARALYKAQTEMVLRQKTPASRRVMPPSPWGYQMDARLREAGLCPDTDGALEHRWSEDREGNLTQFTAMYHGSRLYNAILIGDHWHVTDDN